MRFAFLLLCLLVPSVSFAGHPDSTSKVPSDPMVLIEQNMEIGRAWAIAAEKDSAYSYLNQVLQTIPQLSSHKDLFQIHVNLAIVLMILHDYDLADSVEKAAILFADTPKEQARIYLMQYNFKHQYRNPLDGLPDLQMAREAIGNDTLTELMVDYYLSASSYYIENDELYVALQNLLQAKKITGQSDSQKLLVINHNISVIYAEIQAYPQALEIGEENLRIALENDVHYSHLISLQGLANTHLEMGDFEQTKSLAFQAIQLEGEYDHFHSLSNAYYMLGMSYFETGQIDSAAYFFEQGLMDGEKGGEYQEMNMCYYGLSKVSLAQDQLEEARTFAEKGMKEALPYQQELLLPVLAKSIAGQGKYEQAYRLMEQLEEGRETREKKQKTYLLISSLLDEKFTQEKKQSQQVMTQKLREQRAYSVLVLIVLVMIGLGVLLGWKSRNNRKLKALNQRLQDRNENLQHFAYITSHDLSEPIRNISTFAGLLRLRLESTDSVDSKYEYLDFIHNGAMTLHEIVSSLKTYTQVSFGEQKWEKVSLDEVWQKVSAGFATLLGENKGELKFVNETNSDQIRFESSMLMLILQNLIHNGFKYNDSPQPTVQVRIQKKEEGLLFSVIDNGEGVDEKHQELIFQPFKSLRNKTTNQSSGLGLSICQNILENYGGKIWLESAEGKGSTFYFQIPA